MPLKFDSQDILPVTISSGGLTFPWWNEIVAFAVGTNQVVIAFCALLIALLTVYHMYLKAKGRRLENDILEKELRKPD